MSLTSRDLVLARIRHQETDVTPYTLGFEGDVAERLDAHYGSSAWRGQIVNAIERLPAPHTGLTWDQHAGQIYRDLFGTTWRVDLRPAEHVAGALASDSLDGYAFPAIDDCFEPDWRERAEQTIARYPDRFLTVGIGFGAFERCWTLRGFAECLTDVAANPAFFAELIERVTDHQLALLDRILDLPVDGVMFSDDWGYQQGVIIGPDRWRRYVKPQVARLYARTHQAGKYALTHCCGSIGEIIPDLIEVGLDVLESVQPEARDMSPYDLKRRYGSGITFWGGLGSQSIVPFGTPTEIRAEVSRLCAEMSRGGGYILTTAKSLQPETPTVNAAAVVESFLEAGGARLGI